MATGKATEIAKGTLNKAGEAAGTAKGTLHYLSVQAFYTIQWVLSFYYYFAGVAYGAFWGVLYGTKKYIATLLVDLYRLILGITPPPAVREAAKTPEPATVLGSTPGQALASETAEAFQQVAAQAKGSGKKAGAKAAAAAAAPSPNLKMPEVTTVKTTVQTPAGPVQVGVPAVGTPSK